MKYLLASKSPRRKEIIENLGVSLDIKHSNVNEGLISQTLVPAEYCMKLARLKAISFREEYSEHTIIGADTIVVLDGQIIGKPDSSENALEVLSKLSNRTHEVFTGVSLQNKTLSIDESFYDRTEVTFYRLAEDEILNYINFKKPFDKSGSYGIQECSIFVKHIHGSFENVVGFPVAMFYQKLKALKVI